MRRTALVALLLCLVPGSGLAAAAETHRYLVELAGGGPRDLAAAVERAGGELVHDLGEIGAAAVMSAEPGFARILARAEGIAAVHGDPRRSWLPRDGFGTEDVGLAGAADAAVADAPAGSPEQAFYFPCQWNLSQIDVPGAWSRGELGAGATVAVLDTGVSGDPAFGGGLPHVDMVGQLVGNVTMVALDEPSCAEDGAFDSTSPLDFYFHGTFVAGLVVGRGIRVAGVAPRASVFGVKVLDCRGTGTFGDVIAGILFAADQPEVDVIQMSFGDYFSRSEPGGGRLRAALNRAVNYARARGVLVVSSAGNEAADLDHDRDMTRLPAQAGSGLAVWAGDIDGDLASYSNHGRSTAWLGAGGGDATPDSPQIPLPGCELPMRVQDRIASVCSPEGRFPVCRNGTWVLFGFTGTSFSAPLVSGVAALGLGAHGPMSPGRLATHLKNTADDLGRRGVDARFGHGRVNARRAVER